MKARSMLLAAVFALAVSTAGAWPVLAGPEPAPPGGVTDAALTTIIGTVGDDVFATTDLTGLLNPSGTNGTQHFGPYPSSSPDSGTCGNDWAQDTYDRHFTVHSNPAGQVTVVEQFKNGSFVTTAGPSPGGCDTNVGGTVVAGVNGSMHGYFIISNVGLQTSNSPFCDAVNSTNTDCTTTTFINTHFTACYPVTCTVATYLFNYAAGDQELQFHAWKNASLDRGGNNGDIANT
jgi:hypothetical protein